MAVGFRVYMACFIGLMGVFRVWGFGDLRDSGVYGIYRAYRVYGV